jgi:hypothetical protein
MNPLIEECVHQLTLQLQVDLQTIQEADKKALEALAVVFRGKIREAADNARYEARQSEIENVQATHDVIESLQKALVKRGKGQHLVPQVLDQYSAYLREHDEHIVILDKVYPDLLIDHYNRCMGIYLEKRYRMDCLYTYRVQKLCEHSILYFEDYANTLEDAEIEEMFKLVLQSNSAFVAQVYNNTIEGNADTLKELKDSSLATDMSDILS